MNVAIIGGGVIGLSLAWELSQRGHQITLIDQEAFGKKASWAGAGILLPGNASTAIHPLEHLEALSNDLHHSWAQRLLEQTGIDNGYRNCGGLYVATSAGEVATLAGSLGFWKERSIRVESLDRETFAARYPALGHLAQAKPFAAAWAPDEAQICNPWHVQALVRACELSGVELLPEHAVSDFQFTPQRIASLQVGDQHREFEQIVFACGAWTEQVTADFADCLPMVPVRGQMLLYKLDQPLRTPIVNEGTRYVVPRDDGHVLVGATIEEVGFNESTNASSIETLAGDAERLVPSLRREKLLKSWAGLRPGTHDGFPYMGRLPGWENVFVSTGHFKTGLQLSPGAAVSMADFIEGKTPAIDLTPFAPSRVLNSQL